MPYYGVLWQGRRLETPSLRGSLIAVSDTRWFHCGMRQQQTMMTDTKISNTNAAFQAETNCSNASLSPDAVIIIHCGL